MDDMRAPQKGSTSNTFFLKDSFNHFPLTALTAELRPPPSHTDSGSE